MNNQIPPQAGILRDYLSPEYRNMIVNKIMTTLQKVFLVYKPEEVQVLGNIVRVFEDRAYALFRSKEYYQHDYLRGMSLKMLELKAKYSSLPAYPRQPNPAAHAGQFHRGRL